MLTDICHFKCQVIFENEREAEIILIRENLAENEWTREFKDVTDRIDGTIIRYCTYNRNPNHNCRRTNTMRIKIITTKEKLLILPKNKSHNTIIITIIIISNTPTNSTLQLR